MTAQIIETAKKIVAEVIPTLEATYGVKVPNIQYRTSARMTRTAGNAKVRFGVYTLSISSYTYNETHVKTETFRNTVIHELAHLVEYAIYGKMSDHGFNWREIMRKLGQVPNRMMTVEERKEINLVRAPKRKMTRYSHDCAAKCGAKHYVGGQVHNKIMRGAIYTCTKCGTRIEQNYYLVKI
jgi:predicted SprT family Zn-dependent metalloprotease